MTSVVVVIDRKEHLKVEAAKGSKVRFLPIDNERKAAAVKLHPRNLQDLEQRNWADHSPGIDLEGGLQMNAWRKHGGTKKNWANMHGERHLHAREMRAEGSTKEEIMADLWPRRRPVTRGICGGYGVK